MKVIRITVVMVVLVAIFAFIRVDAQTLQCQTPAQKVQCQADLAQAEADAKAAQAQLVDAQAQSSSLKQAIAVLDAKIKVAQANIKAKNLLIQTLGYDITQKQSHINDLEGHIAKGKETLAVILRKTNEIDTNSLPEILLSQSSVTGFFQDLDTFQSVQDGLAATFNQLRSDEASTSAEKEVLTTRQNTEIDARYAIQQEQKNIQSDQTQKTQLLAISKGNEKAYGTLLAEKQAKAAQIRAALFPLAGGKKIPFGEALQYAEAASAKTGVRPAFLLAILTNESALGANVGNCYLTDENTGNGVYASTGLPASSVMKPTRDVEPFLNITAALGLSPSNTVVSCQQASVGGWGGAMGPAQFIPSTWMLMKDSIASLLGISGMPNPWDPNHAFMASALFLSNLGASSGSYTAERNAACKYFSGSSCSKSRAIASYGDQAIKAAASIQQDINLL
jgi:membrane-bound lytic murein transglycosylase B